MIDAKKIRLLIRDPLLTAAIIDPADIAWEGRKFNPKGKVVWIRETLLPSSELPIAQNTPEFAGIMVYDVFMPSATGTEEIEDFATQIGNIWSPDNDPLDDGSIKAVITSVQRQQIQQDGKWQFIPVHIAFNAYES